MTSNPQSRKCDGNHRGPRCHDPECWNDAALEADEEGVLFGYMDRSVRVSQEAYEIFLDRERALEAQVAALSQQAEPAICAVPDSGDAFYAGLYKKSATRWRRLHDLAVSKGYDHVQFAIECAPVYRCDCMGARKVAIDTEGNTIPCECVTAANEAERAPARSYKDDPRSAKELSLAGCNCVRFGEGNRHWPCSIHAAPAQDEREARALFEEMALIADDERCVQMLAAALATRPAQTAPDHSEIMLGMVSVPRRSLERIVNHRDTAYVAGYLQDELRPFLDSPAPDVSGVVRALDEDASPAQTEQQHPDDEAVDRFAVAMKAKLAASREKGRHGWQNATAPHLSTLLYDHLYKADPLDVGNLAMMLHQNGQAIELPQEARGRKQTADIDTAQGDDQ